MINHTYLHRHALGFVVATVMLVSAARSGEYERALEARRNEYLKAYSSRKLQQGPNPGTWVDVERWCVAHACLVRNTRLDEANRYLAEVEWCSLWHGLVADTDVQVTDLLRTYIEFRKDKRLSPKSRNHLVQMFVEWRVPNPDRNGRADVEYEWPCEYTENHSLNILVGAYLIDVVLDRDRALRRKLLERFLHDRAKWGWSEFHSSSYAVVTAKALTLLADFAPDSSVSKLARMHLDLLSVEFACQSLGHWRGVPFARGYGAQVNNARNSFVELARFWFGDREKDASYKGGTFLAHVLTSDYRPPSVAISLMADQIGRGSYRMTEVATHGPARLRVPIEIWVSPHVTMASAQGFGSYYDGCYWSISFASAPNRVVTGRYGPGRNILQRDNVLVTFGDVQWYGKMTRESRGDIAVGTDGDAFVGHVSLAEGCHLLMVAPRKASDSMDSFFERMTKLEGKFDDGVVSWMQPDGVRIKMVNKRNGNYWELIEAWEGSRRLRLDRNMLYDSPYLRSRRDSGLVELWYGGRSWTYDFRQPSMPRIRKRKMASLPQLPADRLAGPLGTEFVLVPGGEFMKGSSASEGRHDERPQRWVDVPPFYMATTEVTVGQYRTFRDSKPGVTSEPEWYGKKWGKTDKHPITWVAWQDAVTFCAWLSSRGKETYRLPTEAEWEKAAKGFSHRAYPWGDRYDGSQSGWKNGEYRAVASHPLDISPFGIRDMAGNAWEWCADKYGDEGMRLLKGCGWNFDPDTFRCSYRSGMAEGTRSVHVGFRVVMDAPRDD